MRISIHIYLCSVRSTDIFSIIIIITPHSYLLYRLFHVFNSIIMAVVVIIIVIIVADVDDIADVVDDSFHHTTTKRNHK